MLEDFQFRRRDPPYMKNHNIFERELRFGVWCFPFADFSRSDGGSKRSLRPSSFTKKSSSSRTFADSNFVWLTMALIGIGGNSYLRRTTLRRPAVMCSNTCHAGAYTRPPPS